MAQHDYVIDNSTGANVRADINNALLAISSNNSGSSAPSSTFAFQFYADTTNNILKLRNAANDGYINLFTLAGGVDVDAASNFNEDVTFTGASANIVFDKSDNQLEFADNAKAEFGTGGDLKIFHDGSKSVIQDSGTGDLQVASNAFRVNNAANTENMITADENGAVKLYHDNIKRFETDSNGVTVTAPEGVRAELRIIGDEGDDNNDYFKLSSGDGSLKLQDASNGSSWEDNIVINAAGSVELYYDNSKKFETTSTGVTVTGNIFPSANDSHSLGGSSARWQELNISDVIDISDNGKIRIGDGDDLQIYHDGTNNYIDGHNGVLYIRGATNVISLQATDNEHSVRCAPNAEVQLYYDNSKKLETTSSGVTVTGTVTETSDIALKSNIQPLTNTLEKIQQITGYKYNLINSISPSMGVIAQDVEKVFPELVHGSEGKKSLQYSGLIGVLVEAVKDLSAKVAALEAA